MISVSEIREALERYLMRLPGERQALWPLTKSIAEGAQLTLRTEFGGHVTTGAVVLDPAWRVLHVKHRALGHWLLPGGHLERQDESLMDATLRELHEETGIGVAAVQPLSEFEGVPLDIDIHRIPCRFEMDEPEHWHFDFRHVFKTSSGSVVLHMGELTDYRWLPVERMSASRLAVKLKGLQGT